MGCTDITSTGLSYIHDFPVSCTLSAPSRKVTPVSPFGNTLTLKLSKEASRKQEAWADLSLLRGSATVGVLCRSSTSAPVGYEERLGDGIAAVGDGRTDSNLPQNFPENLSIGVSSSVVSFYNNAHKFSSAHEALDSFVTDEPGKKQAHLSEEELALRKSLRERRRSVQEILIEALRASKLSATYSKDVVSSMPEFVDHVMIKAAALRRKREHVNASFSFRARVYIEETGVAKMIKWLKHNGLTVPRIGKLVFLVEDYVGILQPKIEWLKSINVRGRDLGVVLTREPHILERTIEELNDTVEFLQSHGIKRDWIGLVVRRSPKVLSCENKELRERVAFFTGLGINSDDFGTMVFNFPASLGHFSIDEMHSKVEYLKGIGLESDAIGHIIASKPQLIACSIEDGWKPLIKLFYYLGVDGYGMRRILVVQPSVFCLNLAETIAPKVQFLRAVGVHEEAIGGLIVKFPPLLSYSLDKKIRPLVRFLLEMAGVSEDKVGKVLTLQPDLISCSLPNKLQVLVKFFLAQGIQKQELGVMIADFPMLLKYSLSVIKPKFKYVKKIMVRPLKDIIDFPRLFSYSLQSRIAPRHKMLADKGLQFTLRQMLACSDDEFLCKLEANCGTIEVHEKEEIKIAGENG